MTGSFAPQRLLVHLPRPSTHHPPNILRQLRTRPTHIRPFSTSQRLSRSQHRKESFSSRLRSALAATPIRWRPIPMALGVAFLGAFQFYRIQTREQHSEEWRQRRKDGSDPEDDDEPRGKPKKRERIRPSGPWTVQIMSTLPLKALSRIWGRFNELTIPYYLRVPGFKLYGWAFGVNFDEIEEKDLHNFRNLAEFFYRTLKPGVRPLDPTPHALLSPADGRVVQFGIIQDGEVEQVKGVTYSLDSLLGDDHQSPESNISASTKSPQPSASRQRKGDEEEISADEEFARVNGISYTLPSLFSGSDASKSPYRKNWRGKEKTKPEYRHREGGLDPAKDPAAGSLGSSDQSTTPRASSEREVAEDLARDQRHWWEPAESTTSPRALYYCVVYLAPGDYHRFHSPVSWVVSSRRHFAGELYSVSPYLVRTLPGLFTLNERVVLLGKWRYGFFSYTPVGATNVGSIVINFDRELRTNSLTTDTAADRAAEKAKEAGEAYSGYAEANYGSASPVLGGHALKRGEEMGGFMLGSTIVMVFEAPKGTRPSFDEGWKGATDEEGRKGGWKWCIEKGMQVQVGERLGYVEDADD